MDSPVLLLLDRHAIHTMNLEVIDLAKENSTVGYYSVSHHTTPMRCNRWMIAL